MHRTLTEDETNALLVSEMFGHLACHDGKRPYIVPLAYAYVQGVIYGQTTEGRKTEILRKNPQVCFQVQKQDGEVWRSVLCWGTFEELDMSRISEAEAVNVSKLLSEHLSGIQKNVGVSVKFSFDETSAAPLSVEGRSSTIFRIVIDEKSGRSYTA